MVKPSNLDLEKNISLIRKNDRKAQQELYDAFSPAMFGICRRYVKNEQDAEDVMINGFFKVFTKIHQFDGKGSFPAWVKRIMINESLMFLRKYNMNLSVEISENHAITSSDAESCISEKEILKLLDFLPVGYRTVFNLFAIEGFSHQEVAEKLNISVNTSKSQLAKARKKLKQLMSGDYLMQA